MAFQGFGKNSGPSAPVKLQNPFGSFPNAAAPSPPPFRPSPPLQPSPSQSAPQRAPSPPLGFQNKHFFPDISPSSRQIHPVPQRALSPRPPLDLQNKHSFPDLGPTARQIQSQSIPQRAPSPPLGFQNKRSFPDIGPPARQIQRPVSSTSAWGNVSKLSSNFPNHPTQDNQPSDSGSMRSSDSGRNFPVNHADVQAPKRVRSPSQPYMDESSEDDPLFDRHYLKRPSLSPSRPSTKSNVHIDDPQSHQWFPQASHIIDNEAASGRNFPANHADVQAPKRVRSPSQPYMDESSGDDPLFDSHYLKRPSISPSRQITKSNVHIDDPQNHQWFPQAFHNIDNEAASKKPTSFPAPKRTRSPSSPSPEPVFQGNSNAAQDENERELQAKAKRLARFKNELNEPMQSTIGNGNPKAPVKKRDQPEVEKRIFNEEPSDMAGDYPSGNISTDYEGDESSTIIIGVCPDMCPEPERGERERKGDLDQYERVDGDRNQTSISLAVKKYTRTAAREADLIRPMPILQKTLDYLLHLLDQPYDDTFLGSYNFLWDRMRAIRMDLRMQHIFNLGSITMLEQMIRLHIIAMHELCQYTKGEGFSEGFDAHLNIEQMNKTSVELFQLYDDHRKRGIDVPTEKEFRGYYALLKLDKHPGYKVEPAELSLDLAKMTPEIRQAAEVLFARNVARACRTGNFIAFFRLASKASYLQACLMHAHFGKLRSQALASLHSGLQSNQGIPVSQVAKWLGMEEENIEDLLDYHGFGIKDFEEPYMVKEGSFLNGDCEYPLKRSKLVDLKKSQRIVEDVSCPSVMKPSSPGGVKLIHVNKTFKQKPSPVQVKERENFAPAIDDEMAVYETVDSSKKNLQMKPEFKAPVVDKWSGNSNEVGVPSPAPTIFSIAHSSSETSNSQTAHSLFESPKSRDTRISFESPKSSVAPISLNSQISRNSHPSESPKSSTGNFGKPIYDTNFRNSLEKNMQLNTHFTPQIMPSSIELERSPVSPATSSLENQIHQSVFVEDLEAVEYMGMEEEVEPDEVDASHDDEEVAMAKLKLILRIWRRRSLKKKELREQKQLAANAALSSLSLGLPMWQYKVQQHSASDFDIDHIMSERYERHEQSWSRLNVSDVVASILSKRNQHARCLCWKVVFSSYSDHPEEDKLDPGQWLRSKIMPTRNSDNEDLIISSPGLSVWKKWFSDQSNNDLTCCFSVIKESKFDNKAEAEKGASAIMFLVSESISWGSHKIRLHNLLVSIPSGSRLPLLIMVGSYKNFLDPSVVSKELELDAVDKSKISSFLVIPLLEDQQMKNLDGFFSDEQLRKGLQWLASESPLQPLVCCLKTCELVQTHLNLSLEVLENLNANKVSPDQCVSVFNGALDRSIENIINAAKENPISWPCPEIALLEKSTYEYRIADLYLPQIGWSSPEIIEPLLRTLNDCKLPPFPDGTSWLDKGSDFGHGIENQRLRLEDILVTYLTRSTHLMGPPLAQKEASIMLQTCAGLDLHHSTYYIVPKWAMIFRRIFNWRLMNLYSGPSSTAYVLEHNYTDITTSRCSSKLDNEESKSSPYKFNLPSLDEMVDVSCGPYSEHEKFQLPSTQIISYETDVIENGRSIGDEDTLAVTNINLLTNGADENTSSELAVCVKATKEADRLSKLLEQCNIVQNMIDKKLSIYFQ